MKKSKNNGTPNKTNPTNTKNDPKRMPVLVSFLTIFNLPKKIEAAPNNPMSIKIRFDFIVFRNHLENLLFFSYSFEIIDSAILISSSSVVIFSKS